MDDIEAGMSPSPAKEPGSAPDAEHQPELDGDGAEGTDGTATRKRRRGSRGGQRRRKSAPAAADGAANGNGDHAPGMAPAPPADQPELPENPREGRLTPEVAERTLVRKPQIGDTRPAPGAVAAAPAQPRWPRPRRNSRAASSRRVAADEAAASVPPWRPS